ncbi:TfoX/Sxy family protein [Lysobacter sp. Root983]|uniref:TfoX/Sxy family protein n=1 Tax=Lysobacter sp. Root983 TaxID=1736613 RepID=UPI00070F30E0|nr:TfoX/Sxy family protein [Lysobacter sp. Root983]KRD74912.1 transcriptional regulator [Lysobacter sp. Root983]
MSNDYLDYLRDLMAGFGTVTSRRMFGGHGLYRDGVIFALVDDDALYVKVDDVSRAQFEAAGCAPFVYHKQKELVALSYWSVPESALDSAEELRPWLDLAYAAALRKANAPTKKKSRAKRPAR